MSAATEQIELRDRIIEFRRVNRGEILLNPKNPRRHPDTQRTALRNMLATVGIAGAALAYRSARAGGVLVYIDGHLRDEEIPANLPVLITDLNDSEADALLAGYDHLSAMAGQDDAALVALLQSLDASVLPATGYDDAAIRALVESVAAASGDGEIPGGDPEAVLNRAEELKAKFGVERGQIWAIGNHRIMCGDSYDPSDIALLLDGQTPAMLHTDPPYGINIVRPRNSEGTADSGGSKPFGSTSSAKRKSGAAFRSAERGHVQHGAPSKNQIIQSNKYPVIEGDDRDFEPAQFLDFAPIVILWGANYYADKLPTSSGWIVWDKREDITRNTFADCELAWSNLNKPARLFHHLWNGLHKGSQHGERRTHPTEKPVALFEEIGKMYSSDGLWVDLFAGTGAQIVAAQNAGTRCYAMEQEPLYVASVIQRMTDMGLEPKLL